MARRPRKSRRGKRKTKNKKIEPTRSGGFAFFSSLFFLLLLGGMNLFLLPALWDSRGQDHALRFLAGAIVGGWFAHAFVKGKNSVLVHEYKHAIISGLAGNRWKRLKITSSDSGYFRYAYSKKSAEYNAFIALAPYWLPLFTFISLLIALPIWWKHHALIIVIVGMGYGADFIMNMRDISRRQTDITLIRGGYQVGLLYIIAMNTALFTILIAWILQGRSGLYYLASGLWYFVIHIASYYQSK